MRKKTKNTKNSENKMNALEVNPSSATDEVTCVVACVTTVQPPPSSFDIRAPDDLHLHLRDGDRLRDLLKIPLQFKRAIIMPNLKPPIVTTKSALAYRERIIRALAPCNKG